MLYNVIKHNLRIGQSSLKLTAHMWLILLKITDLQCEWLRGFSFLVTITLHLLQLVSFFSVIPFLWPWTNLHFMCDLLCFICMKKTGPLYPLYNTEWTLFEFAFNHMLDKAPRSLHVKLCFDAGTLLDNHHKMFANVWWIPDSCGNLTCALTKNTKVHSHGYVDIFQLDSLNRIT